MARPQIGAVSAELTTWMDLQSSILVPEFASSDDGARLVYADELIERGDPYGEFIATACALERCEDAILRTELGARVDALYAAHGERWLAELGLVRGEVVWRRGFVDRLDLIPARLAQLGDLRALPVRRVRLRQLAGDRVAVARAVAAPLFARVTELDLQDNELDAECVRALAEEPQLARLTALELRRNPLGPDGLRALAEATHLTELRTLGLSSCEYMPELLPGDDGAHALASAHHLTQLVELDLRHGDIGVAGICALSSAPQLAGLQRLRIAGCSMGQEGARAIAAHLTELVELDACTTGVGVLGARALTDRLERIEQLGLCCNDLTAAGVRALVGPRLGALRELWLGDNQLGNSGARLLAGARGMTALEVLGLSGNEIGHVGVRALVGAPHLAGLTTLDLASNPIGWRGAQAIASSTLPALASLDLSATGLGVRGARVLATARLPSLAALHLENTELGDEGVRVLASSPLIRQLTRLALKSNALGPAAARTLRQASLIQLATLDLGHNWLGVEGAQILADTEFPALRELRLQVNQLGTEGALALASAPWLPTLELLRVAPSDEIGDDGFAALRAAAPDLRIIGLGT